MGSKANPLEKVILLDKAADKISVVFTPLLTDILELATNTVSTPTHTIIEAYYRERG